MYNYSKSMTGITTVYNWVKEYFKSPDQTVQKLKPKLTLEELKQEQVESKFKPEKTKKQKFEKFIQEKKQDIKPVKEKYQQDFFSQVLQRQETEKKKRVQEQEEVFGVHRRRKLPEGELTRKQARSNRKLALQLEEERIKTQIEKIEIKYSPQEFAAQYNDDGGIFQDEEIIEYKALESKLNDIENELLDIEENEQQVQEEQEIEQEIEQEKIPIQPIDEDEQYLIEQIKEPLEEEEELEIVTNLYQQQQALYQKEQEMNEFIDKWIEGQKNKWRIWWLTYLKDNEYQITLLAPNQIQQPLVDEPPYYFPRNAGDEVDPQYTIEDIKVKQLEKEQIPSAQYNPLNRKGFMLEFIRNINEFHDYITEQGNINPFTSTVQFHYNNRKWLQNPQPNIYFIHYPKDSHTFLINDIHLQQAPVQTLDFLEPIINLIIIQLYLHIVQNKTVWFDTLFIVFSCVYYESVSRIRNNETGVKEEKQLPIILNDLANFRHLDQFVKDNIDQPQLIHNRIGEIIMKKLKDTIFANREEQQTGEQGSMWRLYPRAKIFNIDLIVYAQFPNEVDLQKFIDMIAFFRNQFQNNNISAHLERAANLNIGKQWKLQNKSITDNKNCLEIALLRIQRYFDELPGYDPDTFEKMQNGSVNAFLELAEVAIKAHNPYIELNKMFGMVMIKNWYKSTIDEETKQEKLELKQRLSYRYNKDAEIQIIYSYFDEPNYQQKNHLFIMPNTQFTQELITICEPPQFILKSKIEQFRKKEKSKKKWKTYIEKLQNDILSESKQNHCYWDIETYQDGEIAKPYCIIMKFNNQFHQFWGIDCIEQLFKKILDKQIFPSDTNHYFWSFNGSKFDNIFLTDYVIDKVSEYNIVGTSGNIKQFQIGQNIFFNDLRCLLPIGSLNSVALAFGVDQKKDLIINNWSIQQFEESKQQVLEYCTQDVQILFEVHAKLIQYIDEICEPLIPQKLKDEKLKLHFIKDKYTLPQISLEIFSSYFLLFDLEGLTNQFYIDACREAYNGGYVSFTNTNNLSQKNKRQQCYYYDFNSSYPFVMKQKFPVKVKNVIHNNNDQITDFNENYLYQASFQYHENWPYPFTIKKTKYDGNIYPMQVEKRWIWGRELRFIQEHHLFDLKIPITVYKIIEFEDGEIFNNYIDTLYNKRKILNDNIQKEKSMRIILKLLLNSLYGKMAQKQYQKSILISKQNLTKILDSNYIIQKITRCSPNIYKLVYRPQTPVYDIGIGQLIHIGSSVSSKARVQLMKINLALEEGSRVLQKKLIQDRIYSYEEKQPSVIYNDTDSAISIVPLYDGFVHQSELGKMKLEHTITKIQIVAPKLYYYITDEEQKYFIAKGINQKNKEMTEEDFEQLLQEQNLQWQNENTFQRLLGSVRIFNQNKTINWKWNKREFDENRKYCKPWKTIEDYINYIKQQ